MRSKILSKPIFASCVILRSRVLRVVCPHFKDIGRRLPLQLQCSYQGQQGDVRQSVRGNYKTLYYEASARTLAAGLYLRRAAVRWRTLSRESRLARQIHAGVSVPLPHPGFYSSHFFRRCKLYDQPPFSQVIRSVKAFVGY